MRLLKNFKSFREKRYLKEESFYNDLRKGQAPETLFITCSDSRILPNEVTGTKEGELFVIRNAGNALPPFGAKSDLATSATIEYAICVLGVKEIVVCGHAHCGAVGARTNQSSVPDTLGYLHDYLNTLPDFKEKDVAHNIKLNILHQLENLLTYPYVKEKYDAGELDLIGWLYHFDEGNLEVLSHPEKEFKSWEGESNERNNE